MEREQVFRPKRLSLTYEEYQEKDFTLINKVIGKYVVQKQIGGGSFSKVFYAMNDQTKQQVVLKIKDLRKIKAVKDDVQKKIRLRLAESEPRLMYECNSPYVLKCFDVYQNEDLKIIVTQYCNGETLQKEIQQKGRIPQNEAWLILKHIINGLIELHKHNIIHRDIKSSNIMFHNGTYKIFDFGFSKQLQSSSAMTTTALGTITTMAPEVCGKKPHGLKADIWSLGIIFFQMIFGMYPYDSTTAKEMYKEIHIKKVFLGQKPLTYNGYTASEEAKNFLRFILVLDSKNRPDWKAVSEYSTIKGMANTTLPQRFIKECKINLSSGLNYQQKAEQDCNKDLQEKEKQFRERERPISVVEVIDISNFDARKKEKEVNKDQEQEYQWTQMTHLECLKTQFVFNEILRPLKNSGVLNIENRSSVEFYYLLAARCFNNMSPINDKIQDRTKTNRNRQLVQNLKNQVATLYNEVQKEFLDLSKKLTICENYKMSILNDWFSKKFSSKKFGQKDKFFQAIQIIDYSKEQQVDFTCSYYKNNIENTLKQGKDMTSIILRMLHYQQIMLIPLDDLKKSGKNFEQQVQEILQPKN